MYFGIAFPVLVDVGVAKQHIVNPFALPLIEVGGADAGDGGTQSPVRPRTVRTEEHAEVQRDP